MRRWVRLGGPILSVLLVESLSADAAPWRDPSPHAVRFVTVDDGVRLEVLDWGGSGRSVVLLAGGGSTAHVFDDFAPKLAAHYRVYGITRRGCGASGFAESPNPVDRLRNDLLSSLDVLGLDRPVLAGHSIAGAEMRSRAGSLGSSTSTPRIRTRSSAAPARRCQNSRQLKGLATRLPGPPT
jgi:hypothetical protein